MDINEMCSYRVDCKFCPKENDCAFLKRKNVNKIPANNMDDKEKIIKIKEIIKNQNTYTKEEVIDYLYESTLEDIKDAFVEWNEVLNKLKEIIYHD